MFLPTNITLKFGDSGDFVAELQRRLAAVKCFSESMVNGFFDGNTVNGVSRFQSMSGIHADGIAGPETLRRLNGAISGDFAGGSTGNPNQAEEEERKRREAEVLRQQQLREQQFITDLEKQHVQQTTYEAPETHPYAAQHYPSSTAAPQPTYEPTPAAQQQPYAAPPPQPTYQQAPPPSGPSAAELLAQMLTQNQPPQPIAQASQPPSVPPQVHAPQSQMQPTYPPQVPTTSAPKPAHSQAAQAQPPQQSPPYEPPPAPQTPTPEQQRGIVGRAMQYANEVIGKLAAYFEAKLPRHVIDEVKQIGHQMAHSGVKEVPIPQGPEQQRERGPEQQRGAQQGRQVG